MDTATVIAIIAAISSIVTPFALMSYKEGKRDVKIDTLWDVYTASVMVREQLRHNPHPRDPVPIPEDIAKIVCALHLGTGIGKKGRSIIHVVTVKRISEIALANKVGFGEVVASLMSLGIKQTLT